MGVLWCVTGGGHMMRECADRIKSTKAVTVAFSQAGEEVARLYKVFEQISSSADEVILERNQGKSAPAVMRLGRYEKVIVAPATANTVAKIANGVADTLVTNIIAQSLKLGLPVRLLPTDAEEKIVAETISARKITINTRKIDLENLRKISGEVTVVKSVEEL